MLRAGVRAPAEADGYAAHVHSKGLVIADEDASLVGLSTARWFARLGLPSNLLEGREPSGEWLEPVELSPVPP